MSFYFQLKSDIEARKINSNFDALVQDYELIKKDYANLEKEKNSANSANVELNQNFGKTHIFLAKMTRKYFYCQVLLNFFLVSTFVCPIFVGEFQQLFLERNRKCVRLKHICSRATGRRQHNTLGHSRTMNTCISN